MPPKKAPTAARKRQSSAAAAGPASKKKATSAVAETDAQKIARLTKEIATAKRGRADATKKVSGLQREVTALRHEITHLDHKLHMEEQLRRNFIAERSNQEQKSAQERAKHQQERMKFQKKIDDLEKKMQDNIDAKVQEQFKVELKKERESTAFYRKELMEMTGRLAMENKPDGEIWPWKLCEKCKKEYKATGKQAPRLLECGHTFCEGCIGQMRDKKDIACPACHHTTTLKNYDTKKLLLNKLVMQM